jgi:hypothetical protein
MAGPCFLDPGMSQGNIPTWQWTRQTTVIVDNKSPQMGKISLKAGASPTEHVDVGPATEIQLERSFAGFS